MNLAVYGFSKSLMDDQDSVIAQIKDKGGIVANLNEEGLAQALVGNLDALVCNNELVIFTAATKEILKLIHQCMIRLSELEQNSEMKNLKDQTLPVIAKLLEANQENAFLLNQWGKLLFMVDDANAAIDAFNRAIKINPNYAEPYSNLGTLLWQFGKKRDAAYFFTESLIRMPENDAFMQNFLESVYDLQEHDGMIRVLNYLKDKIQVLPANLSKHLALAYYKVGQLNKAKEIIAELELAKENNDEDFLQLKELIN